MRGAGYHQRLFSLGVFDAFDGVGCGDLDESYRFFYVLALVLVLCVDITLK